jgi:ElaB/YqjD/DUF883 family membrane-anchored ribosome-binding protein
MQVFHDAAALWNTSRKGDGGASMTNDGEAQTPSGEAGSAARHAQHVVDAAKEYLAAADLDQLRTKAADAASAVYRESRDFVSNNPELAKATDELRQSIRRNPLAAIGIAFTAGLLLALLTRG